jgi:hypothetical protein
MQSIKMLVVVGSIVAASIAGLNVAQVVYAASSTTGTCPCGSGNPHVPDPDTGIVPKGHTTLNLVSPMGIRTSRRN